MSIRYQVIAITAVLFLFIGCSHEEESIGPSPSGGHTINVTYAGATEIEVDPVRHWALLLNDRRSPRGTALQLVDLDGGDVLATRILDYYDVFDVEYISETEGCFAGSTQDRREFAVQFFSLPDLTLGTRVMTADTSGNHGYLAVDRAGGNVYYSHAGGGNSDGVFRIRLSNKTIVDADNDDATRAALDNDLVSGLFNEPSRLFFDSTSHKLIAANLGDDFITQIDASLWGTLRRGDNLSFPIAGTAHLQTLSGSLNSARPEAMQAEGTGVFVFAGSSGNTAFLSRTEINAIVPYPAEIMPASRQWIFRNHDIYIHPRDDIRSVFVLQRDSTRIGIGRYNLNNLQPVNNLIYRTRTIPDSLISAIGLETTLDWLVVADSRTARLELVEIE